MEPKVQELLLELNREFYQSFAEDFAESRARPQPGILPILRDVGPQEAILDLGCGHGTLADALAQRAHEGTYVGVDQNAELLEIARGSTVHPNARFERRDLTESGWSEGLDGAFSWIFLLALLHHLPGSGRRRELVRSMASLSSPAGKVVVSVWNFPSDPKWRRRVVAWEAVGLDAQDVEEGDALLDWRRGGRGLRYVHHFTEQELAHLGVAGGYRRTETRHAGGTSAELNRIQIWQRR